jgi:hypothetical protein
MTREARLLERDVELEALVGRLAPLAASGAGGVVLVEGVAGIGKSSLLRAFVAAARERPQLTVLTARGTELELGAGRSGFGGHARRSSAAPTIVSASIPK